LYIVGEIQAVLLNHSNKILTIPEGGRFGQFTFERCWEPTIISYSIPPPENPEGVDDAKSDQVGLVENESDSGDELPTSSSKALIKKGKKGKLVVVKAKKQQGRITKKSGVGIF